MPFDLSSPMTQADFGRLVGVSQPTVSGLVTSGVLSPEDTGHLWLLAYCARLREQAAGRASDGDLDLVQERAALARAQRIAQELKTSVARGEYAPIGLLGDVLAAASSAVVDRLDGLEGLLRKTAPDLPEEARSAILNALAGARNEWVRATSRLVVEQLEAMDDDDGEEPVES
jgi:phage terminase Nu1 subunit (DNA packaging protein)